MAEQPITREWLEEQLALCARATPEPWASVTLGRGGAIISCDPHEPRDNLLRYPLRHITDGSFVVSARTGYPALLQWALEALRRVEGWEHDALIYAQNAALHEKRERRLKEALASLLVGIDAMPINTETWAKYLRRSEGDARVLLNEREELKEVPHESA